MKVYLSLPRHYLAGSCLWICFLTCGFWGGAIASAAPGKADAIVLLAGSYHERVGTAARLFRAGFSDRILLTNDGVLTGWSKKHQRNLYSVERTEEALVRQGVPREGVIRLPFYRSGTVYDALITRNYLARHRLTSILLVTSDYHAARAEWIFCRVLGRRAVAVAAAPTRSSATNYLLESLKFLFYRIRYGFFDVPSLLL